jgi:hypothetical protein
MLLHTKVHIPITIKINQLTPSQKKIILRYSGEHKRWPKAFCGENRGDHKSWVPFMPPYHLSMISMGEKQISNSLVTNRTIVWYLMQDKPVRSWQNDHFGGLDELAEICTVVHWNNLM